MTIACRVVREPWHSGASTEVCDAPSAAEEAGSSRETPTDLNNVGNGFQVLDQLDDGLDLFRRRRVCRSGSAVPELP